MIVLLIFQTWQLLFGFYIYTFYASCTATINLFYQHTSFWIPFTVIIYLMSNKIKCFEKEFRAATISKNRFFEWTFRCTKIWNIWQLTFLQRNCNSLKVPLGYFWDPKLSMQEMQFLNTCEFVCDKEGVKPWGRREEICGTLLFWQIWVLSWPAPPCLSDPWVSLSIGF